VISFYARVISFDARVIPLHAGGISLYARAKTLAAAAKRLRELVKTHVVWAKRLSTGAKSLRRRGRTLLVRAKSLRAGAISLELSGNHWSFQAGLFAASEVNPASSQILPAESEILAARSQIARMSSQITLAGSEIAVADGPEHLHSSHPGLSMFGARRTSQRSGRRRPRNRASPLRRALLLWTGGVRAFVFWGQLKSALNPNSIKDFSREYSFRPERTFRSRGLKRRRMNSLPFRACLRVRMLAALLLALSRSRTVSYLGRRR